MFAPYRYGYELPGNKKCRGDLSKVEADATATGEQRNPGTWERLKTAVRYAWDRAGSKPEAA